MNGSLSKQKNGNCRDNCFFLLLLFTENYDANPEDPMAKFSKPVSKKSATDMSKVKNRVLERIEEDKLEELRHTRGSGLCTRKRKGTSSSTKADGDSSSSLTSYRPDFSSELKKDSEKKKNKKEMEREAARRRMEHNEKLRRKNAAATLPASSFTDLVKLASKSPSDKKKMTLEVRRC